MLSSIELDHLTESDIGRCLSDVDGLKGWVRIESRPARRVVVDFSMRLGAAGRQRIGQLLQQAEFGDDGVGVGAGAGGAGVADDVAWDGEAFCEGDFDGVFDGASGVEFSDVAEHHEA